MTFGVTLLTTVLIAYKIYSYTRCYPRMGVTRTFKNIAEVLVQSAAAYSLAALLAAVLAIIPQNSINETVWFSAENYAGALLFVTAGMAPTIMVARVAMQELPQVEESCTTHLSDLEFRADSSPSGNTSQILSHGIRVRVGASRADMSSEGHDLEKRRPLEALVEEEV
ncbi:hypothetical protein HYPSUDRAFT_206386 [Hypholoma sublateritium FD-334 SS-4]|uniref:Uncharacterized protein n=1 Tax=Hypholoma sublateritium (strain FD-334 SS-4) TaxID=945553 RepID=A0A0D2NDV5_HYPSF|nr:hypothetical protein HYPSUDRAFT_206386 [Hypholoma sublateritium FD-334 SS-4]